MAKKSTRKPSGAARMAVIDDDLGDDTNDAGYSTNGVQSDSEVTGTKPGRKTKPKAEQQSSANFVVGDIKKAAAFANSVGGLDKAIAVLQILKVAKEVQ